MTVPVDNSISLEALPTFGALFELNGMCDGMFNQALMKKRSYDLVAIHPGAELNSSSLMDAFIFDDTKKVLGSRSKSAILQDPMDPFYFCLKYFRTWFVMTHHPFYLLIELFVMKLTWFLDQNTALYGSGP